MKSLEKVGSRSSRKRHQRPRRVIATAIAAVLCIVAVLGTTATGVGAASTGQRIDLRVLVLTDGNPNVEAISAELTVLGIPQTRIDLTAPGRPVVNAAFLSGLSATGPQAYYQSVVTPNDNPPQLSVEEKTALANFETTFGVRQVNAFMFPSLSVGLNPVTGSGPTGGFVGTLDGFLTKVTPVGKAFGPFYYLNGNVQFEDIDPGVPEAFGYIAIPRPNTPTTSFATLVDAQLPGSSQRGSLIGIYKTGNREQLVVTAAMNIFQSQFQALVHGIVTWMTRGVHLGYERNYFNVQVDDTFLPDSRWSVEHNCTPGDDCPPGSPATTPDIRMTADDVVAAAQWSQQTGIRLDMAFNGAGSVEAIELNGSDALTNAFLANKNAFGWINHTYDHQWLGCVQNFTVVPWQCATDGSGTQWTSQADLEFQISQNIAWAQANGIQFNPTELVTGEHSGLATLPQQPTDNPFLASALTNTGILVTASDNSREPQPRQIGSAVTVPRYPMSVFYNTATRAEAADEYNWIYNSAADGGSGYCTDHPDVTTCIPPLDLATGYANYIVPTETRIDMFHIQGNDPRPHYAHVSNLAEERILYLPLNSIVNRYRSTYAPNTPIVQPGYTEQSNILGRQAAWKARIQGPVGAGEVAQGVTAYVLNGRVFVQTSGNVNVPLTAPLNAKVGTTAGPLFGESYQNERSAWSNVGGTPLIVALASGAY